MFAVRVPPAWINRNVALVVGQEQLPTHVAFSRGQRHYQTCELAIFMIPVPNIKYINYIIGNQRWGFWKSNINLTFENLPEEWCQFNRLVLSQADYIILGMFWFTFLKISPTPPKFHTPLHDPFTYVFITHGCVWEHITSTYIFASGDILSHKRSHNTSHHFCDVWILENILKIHKIIFWTT